MSLAEMLFLFIISVLVWEAFKYFLGIALDFYLNTKVNKHEKEKDKHEH